MKILLTGASGFIGKEILKALLKYRNLETIYACYNESKIDIEDDRIKKLKFNILNQENLKKNLHIVNVDIIIHAAWFVKHPEYKSSLKNFEYIKASYRLAELCKEKNDIKKFIFIGSSFEENEEYADVYSKAKEITTFCLTKIFTDSDIYFQVARPSFAIGLNEYRTKLLSNTILKMMKNEKIECMVPNNYINFIDTIDIGRTIAAMAFSNYNNDINIGNDEEISIKDIILYCAKVLNYNIANITFKENTKYNMNFKANVEKVGYIVKNSVFDTIDELIKYYKNEK